VSCMKAEQRIQLAYPEKFARDIIVRLARPINKHLLMLDFPAEPRQHFRRELRNWLAEIQAPLEPTMRTGSFRFYFDPLFDYPFGGVELENMRGLVGTDLSGIRNISDENAGAARAMAQALPYRLAERLHRGEESST
jgi:hypothetical protein